MIINMYKEMFGLLTKPKEKIVEKKNLTAKEGYKYLALGLAVPTIVIMLFYILWFGLFF